MAKYNLSTGKIYGEDSNHGDLITFPSLCKALPGQPVCLLWELPMRSLTLSLPTKCCLLTSSLEWNHPHVSALPLPLDPTPCSVLCVKKAEMVQATYKGQYSSSLEVKQYKIKDEGKRWEGKKDTTRTFLSFSLSLLPKVSRKPLALSALFPTSPAKLMMASTCSRWP